MDDLKITVVTPSFNQGRYLEETLLSIIRQKYPNLEWFVVDGGSTDNSLDIIRRHEGHFAWWVSEKDRNHAHALNKGYSRATGDVFCFVNSDDTLEPGALNYVARQFRDPGVKWVVGWAKYFQDDGDQWPYPPKQMSRPVDFLVVNPVPQIASFWRTEALGLVGPSPKSTFGVSTTNTGSGCISKPGGGPRRYGGASGSSAYTPTPRRFPSRRTTSRTTGVCSTITGTFCPPVNRGF